MNQTRLPYLLSFNPPNFRDFSLAPLYNAELKQTYPISALANILSRPDRHYIVEEAKALLPFLDDVPNATAFLCISTLRALVGAPEKSLNELLSYLERNQMGALAALECSVISPLFALEKKGLPFDAQKWQRALDRLATEADILSDKLSPYFLSSGGFSLFNDGKLDWNNPDFIRQGLSRALDRPVLDVSAAALSSIDHEAAQLLLALRQKTKLLSAYGESLLGHVTNGRLRGSYSVSGTISGRITCQHPNLQALPQDEIFQQCIRADHGRSLLYFDFSGFELRILSAMAHDAEMIEIFEKNADIHSEVAKKIFNKPVSKHENSHLREYAKVINFGLIYGMGKNSIASKLGISPHKAEELLKEYFKRFANINNFLLEQEQQGLKEGYIHTALNRRYYFSEHDDEPRRKRLARNLPIQGTGAEIIKMAMCRVHDVLNNNFSEAYLINTIHDELVVECRNEHKIAIGDVVKRAMVASFASILDDVTVGIDLAEGLAL